MSTGLLLIVPICHCVGCSLAYRQLRSAAQRIRTGTCTRQHSYTCHDQHHTRHIVRMNSIPVQITRNSTIRNRSRDPSRTYRTPVLVHKGGHTTLDHFVTVSPRSTSSSYRHGPIRPEDSISPKPRTLPSNRHPATVDHRPSNHKPNHLILSRTNHHKRHANPSRTHHLIRPHPRMIIKPAIKTRHIRLNKKIRLRRHPKQQPLKQHSSTHKIPNRSRKRSTHIHGRQQRNRPRSIRRPNHPSNKIPDGQRLSRQNRSPSTPNRHIIRRRNLTISRLYHTHLTPPVKPPHNIRRSPRQITITSLVINRRLRLMLTTTRRHAAAAHITSTPS